MTLNVHWRPLSASAEYLKRLEVPWALTQDNEDTPETIRCLWPFFRIYRIIGMCPIRRDENFLVVAPKWHPTWYFTWFALLVQIMVWLNYIIREAGKYHTESHTVSLLNAFIFYTQIVLTTIFMIWKGSELPNFINCCVKVEGIIKGYQEAERKDTGLMRDTYILFLFYMITHFCEISLYYTSIARQYNSTGTTEFFALYNEEFIFIGGNAFTGLLYLISQFYVDLGWTFPDMLLALLTLMLGRLFSRINKVLAKNNAFPLDKIEQLRSDHQEICNLVELCNNIFAPLFLLTFIGNMTYLFTRLIYGVGHDLQVADLFVQLEAIYSFIFLIFIKILMPYYIAARLHERAHEGLESVHSWISCVLLPEVKFVILVIERFVSQLSGKEIGISGCGYFLITKGFLLTLIGGIITYEIILLQFQAVYL